MGHIVPRVVLSQRWDMYLFRRFRGKWLLFGCLVWWLSVRGVSCLNLLSESPSVRFCDPFGGCIEPVREAATLMDMLASMTTYYKKNLPSFGSLGGVCLTERRCNFFWNSLTILHIKQGFIM